MQSVVESARITHQFARLIAAPSGGLRRVAVVATRDGRIVQIRLIVLK